MIAFTQDEKHSELGKKLREYLEQRIEVLNKKNEKIGLPGDETEGLRYCIKETRLFLDKLKVKP